MEMYLEVEGLRIYIIILLQLVKAYTLQADRKIPLHQHIHPRQVRY
jgi:hypothetical protein